MKARLLKKLLNDTEYIVHGTDTHICIGSPMCSDLISVDRKTLNMRYALDTFREGRKALLNARNSKGESELLFIWDKLAELIESGEINNIINGYDDLETILKVYTVADGVVIITYTDSYGWPNVTNDGVLMYENTHFKTYKEALDYGIKDSEAGVKIEQRRVERLKKELKEAEASLSMNEYELAKLEALNRNYTNSVSL